LRVTPNEPNSLPGVLSTSTTSQNTQPADEMPKRNSSRKSLMSSFRDLEKPGSGIGLVEPVVSANLGLFPVYVTATKKSLVLSITQRSVIETMDGFREDVALLREGLLKEHKSIIDSLKIPETPDSPAAVCQNAMAKAAKKDIVVITDEVKNRVAALETRVASTLDCMSKIQEDIASLPQILQVLEKAADSGDLIAKLAATGERPQ